MIFTAAFYARWRPTAENGRHANKLLTAWRLRGQIMSPRYFFGNDNSFFSDQLTLFFICRSNITKVPWPFVISRAKLAALFTR